ncbi:MAG: transglutaminase-like domain-containing protein [Gemmatimonadales bacterium]
MQVGLTRRNIGRLVLLIWAVSLAWLARRQFGGGPSSAIAERARRLEPGAQYFAVMAGDRQIGQLNRGVDTLVDGVRLTELLVLDLPDGDSTRQLARSWNFELSRSLRLRRFERTVFGIGPRERLDGGLGRDSQLVLRNWELDVPASEPVRIGADRDPILPAMVPLRAAFGNHLRVGEQFTLPLLDLGSGAVRPLTIRVTAESTFVVADSARWDSAKARWVPATFDTVEAFRLEHDALGAPTVAWVEPGGALVAETIAGGWTLTRSAFEIVGNNYRRGRLQESSAWRRGVPGMVGLAALGDSAARRLGGSAARRSDIHPAVRPSGRPATEDWLGPSWDLAPLGNPEIRTAADRALRGARSGKDSAAALVQWVAARARTEVHGSGTAMNTLRGSQGSPDGKARLLVSLARASGIPARVVRGIAALPQGAFAHAWGEMWVAGNWRTGDPSLGHVPAASLIPISIGERSRPTDLVPLVASARFLPVTAHR